MVALPNNLVRHHAGVVELTGGNCFQCPLASVVTRPAAVINTADFGNLEKGAIDELLHLSALYHTISANHSAGQPLVAPEKVSNLFLGHGWAMLESELAY